MIAIPNKHGGTSRKSCEMLRTTITIIYTVHLFKKHQQLLLRSTDSASGSITMFIIVSLSYIGYIY